MAAVPKGWSKPLKASEIAKVFPMTGTITWNGPPQRWRSNNRRPVVWLWYNEISKIDQPVLTLWAVPSAARASVSEWIRTEVGPAAADWWAEITQSEVLLASRPSRQWSYNFDQ
jgi:hypothetical protein